MSHPTAQETADILSRFVNGMRSDDLEELATLLQRDHPTLVTSKARVFVRFFELGTEDEGDLRREALAKLSQAIVALPADVKHLPFL